MKQAIVRRLVAVVAVALVAFAAANVAVPAGVDHSKIEKLSIGNEPTRLTIRRGS